MKAFSGSTQTAENKLPFRVDYEYGSTVPNYCACLAQLALAMNKKCKVCFGRALKSRLCNEQKGLIRVKHKARSNQALRERDGTAETRPVDGAIQDVLWHSVQKSNRLQDQRFSKWLDVQLPLLSNHHPLLQNTYVVQCWDACAATNTTNCLAEIVR